MARPLALVPRALLPYCRACPISLHAPLARTPARPSPQCPAGAPWLAPALAQPLLLAPPGAQPSSPPAPCSSMAGVSPAWVSPRSPAVSLCRGLAQPQPRSTWPRPRRGCRPRLALRPTSPVEFLCPLPRPPSILSSRCADRAPAPARHGCHALPAAELARMRASLLAIAAPWCSDLPVAGL
jgi:hypothetical protein|uniref:Uncharacterized protein n=1 Tax=Zea mays TaxID=4577 RepID=B6SLN1_MAIZE|nr:hypothetical protein [Zea mays]